MCACLSSFITLSMPWLPYGTQLLWVFQLKSYDVKTEFIKLQNTCIKLLWTLLSMFDQLKCPCLKLKESLCVMMDCIRKEITNSSVCRTAYIQNEFCELTPNYICLYHQYVFTQKVHYTFFESSICISFRRSVIVEKVW